MRFGEGKEVVKIFADLRVPVGVINAEDKFFQALDGVGDPEEKREAITQTFYKKVFGGLVREVEAKFLLQGTNLTDIDETIAGIKRQHNILEQLGIDTVKEYGYTVIEPLVQLRKDGVRLVAKALGLPEEIYNRPPFPGPALATRAMGPVTKEKVELVRRATTIMEEVLKDVDYFQSMAILHEDRVTGIVNNKRKFGNIIEIRCWASTDARTGDPIAIPHDTLFRLGDEIPQMIPDVVNVVYCITRKPPVTMEAF